MSINEIDNLNREISDSILWELSKSKKIIPFYKSFDSKRVQNDHPWLNNSNYMEKGVIKIYNLFNNIAILNLPENDRVILKKYNSRVNDFNIIFNQKTKDYVNGISNPILENPPIVKIFRENYKKYTDVVIQRDRYSNVVIFNFNNKNIKPTDYKNINDALFTIHEYKIGRIRRPSEIYNKHFEIIQSKYIKLLNMDFIKDYVPFIYGIKTNENEEIEWKYNEINEFYNGLIEEYIDFLKKNIFDLIQNNNIETVRQDIFSKHYDYYMARI